MDANSQLAVSTDKTTKKGRRPIAITIVGIVLIFTSFINLFVGAAYIFTSYEAVLQDETIHIDDLFSDSTLDNADEVLVEGVLYFILGLVQLVISIGFWRLSRWAWVAAMTWQAIKLLLEIVNFFVADVTIVSLVFTILLVLLLNQSDVRRAFRILNRPNESPHPPINPLNVH